MDYKVYYKFLGNDSSLVVPADSPEQALAELARLYPQIKTAYKAEPVPTKTPAWLQVGELHWDASMASFIACLVEHSTIFSDAPSHATRACEDKFYELSRGEVHVWPSPPYGSVADAERYGARAIISFPADTPIPAALRTFADAGKIQRMSFFWALVELGFVPGKQQNVERIESRLPEYWRAAFHDSFHVEVAR